MGLREIGGIELTGLLTTLGGWLVVVSILGFGASLYFLPTMMVYDLGPDSRKKMVFWINLLAGWTILGWVVAWILASY